MATASIQDVLQLPVYTVGGTRLGKVADIEFDVETHQAQAYLVKPGRLSQPLVRRTLKIHRSQVVAITAEKMIVEDSVSRSSADQRARSVPRGAASPLSARIG